MEIITRKDAKINELSTYYTGKLCANGHLSYRYVQSGSCYECINGHRVASSPRPGETRSEALRRKADELEKRENEVMINKNNMLAEREKRALEREKRALENETKVQMLAERNKVMNEFVEIKCPVRSHYIERVKALLLAYAIMRCPHITAENVWVGGTPKHQVLYRMFCHPDDVTQIRTQINAWFSLDANIDKLREQVETNIKLNLT